MEWNRFQTNPGPEFIKKMDFFFGLDLLGLPFIAILQHSAGVNQCFFSRIYRNFIFLFLAALLFSTIHCRPGKGISKEPTADAMGTWKEWSDLTPFIRIAQDYAPPSTTAALQEMAKLLRQHKPKTADRKLAELADSEGRHWIAVARSNVAAFYFTVCVRGVAWRLEDGDGKQVPTRRIDVSEDTKIEPGDVSVESMLTNLDAATQAKIPALATQARIARARVTAFVRQCAPNDEVAQMSESTLKNDLATLAAEHHLTPDLAYLWAGFQYSEFSGAAAKPFLLQAREAGFDEPSLVYMLAVIALEQRDFDKADQYASEAFAAYQKLEDRMQMAQTLFIRGEVARAKQQAKAARSHYEAAVKLAPNHPSALLGITMMVLDSAGEQAAIAYLYQALPNILFHGPFTQVQAESAAQNIEALIVSIKDPGLASICREALLYDIDAEPQALRRGLRYLYVATLDVRLGAYEQARGHGVLAQDEFLESEFPELFASEVETFLDHLRSL